MQAVGPAPAHQRAAGELVDDHHLAVAHDVVHVALVDGMGAQGGVEVMDHAQVLRRVQTIVLVVLQDAGLAQQVLGVGLAGLGQVHLLGLLIDPVVALAFLALLLDQRRHDAVDAHVKLRRIVGRAGDDQRRARLVDQDRVDLVDDGEVELALVAVLARHGHVVAQVVEAELVVGAVGDVAGVGRALVAVRHARVDHAHAQAQPVVQLAHLRRVAAGQVVVDRDHVHALAFQRVEVHGQGRDQGLALAGAHLGDLAQVQHHAADQLHVVVAQAQHAARGLAAHGEGLGRILSSASPSATRFWNSGVLAFSSSSLSFCSSGSSALMRTTRRSSCSSRRSLRLPKTRVSKLLIMKKNRNGKERRHHRRPLCFPKAGCRKTQRGRKAPRHENTTL